LQFTVKTLPKWVKPQSLTKENAACPSSAFQGKLQLDNRRFRMSTPGNSIDTKTSSAARAEKAPSVWDIYYPRSTAGHQSVIYLASFPAIIFFWPTILVCFFAAFFQGVGLSPVSVGWLFTFVFLFNFLVLVQDFDQKQFLIVTLAFLACVLLIWIANLYGIVFFRSIAAWIATFQPVLSTDFYLLAGFLLLVFFVWGSLSPVFSYWMFAQNEFVHYTQPVGRDISIARTGCTVSKEIPDVLECMLSFGGGSLVIKRDNQTIATIANVPFLSRRMHAIEHMLSETRVTVAAEG